MPENERPQKEDGMSGTCKDCKHWVGYSLEDKHVWGACGLTKSDKNIPEHKRSNAVSFTEGRVFAVLETARDFGCNQFESKG